MCTRRTGQVYVHRRGRGQQISGHPKTPARVPQARLYGQVHERDDGFAGGRAKHVGTLKTTTPRVLCTRNSIEIALFTLKRLDAHRVPRNVVFVFRTFADHSANVHLITGKRSVRFGACSS